MLVLAEKYLIYELAYTNLHFNQYITLQEEEV